MEFRLVYRGQLSTSPTARDKHAIREAFHPQLKQLWSVHPRLRVPMVNMHMLEGHMIRRLGGFRFVPLVCGYFNNVCALDILFLRREEPGELIRHGGDIDNRLKGLFDGLRIAQDNELIGEAPRLGEDPFHCLLEDDKLITELKVTHD